MLSENIKARRTEKGLSQEALASRLHVVRQTVSKWEQGLSVPDAELLIALSEALDTPVSDLLGQTRQEEAPPDDLRRLSQELEALNLSLAQAEKKRRRGWHLFFWCLLVLIVVIFAFLFFLGSPYLNWDMSDPELAVIGTALHLFEFVFVRLAPFALLGAVAGVVLTGKK